MKIQLFVFVWLLSVTLVSAQEESAKPPAVSTFILKGTMGITGLAQLSFTDAEWDRMTPGFPVTTSFQVNPNGTDHFSKYRENDYWMLSFSFINNKEKAAGKNYRLTTTLHFGLGQESIANRYWLFENRQVIDTVVSNQTGAAYPVLGNRRQEIQKSYRIKSTMIGIGEHVATNPEGILQFETGLDVFFSFASAHVNAYFSDSYLIEGLGDGTYAYPVPADLAGKQVTEYAEKTTCGLILRVPLELSVPLSRKNTVLKRMRIGCEWNFGVTMLFTRNRTNYSWYSNAGLNFRYEFYRFRSPFRSKYQKQVSN